MRQASSASSLTRTIKNEQLMEFCKMFSPDYQSRICGDTDECFFGNYPTLGQLKTEYGRNAATVWMTPQLHNLSEYSGCKGKLTGEALKDCAYVIGTAFDWLKVSEVMLFFHRFKTGQYGRFYGNVDPLVITESLRKFCEERHQAYDRKEKEDRERRDEEYRKTAISYEEWLAMKKNS